MEAERARRLKAGATLARTLASRETRDTFKANGHTSGQEILLALDTDSIGTVLRRAMDYTPPVIVAVYFEAANQVKFMTLVPGESPGLLNEDIGVTATIGMLYEYMDKAKRRGISIRLTEWTSAVQINEFALA